jgi:hypothetical protein
MGENAEPSTTTSAATVDTANTIANTESQGPVRRRSMRSPARWTATPLAPDPRRASEIAMKAKW